MGNERATHVARLSVIVPVYRAENYIAECLESILSHIGDDLEVIAVNDGSTDHSGLILDKYARLDSRLRVVHLPVNGGMGQARNVGLDHAIGEYVWFVDADDWLPAGAVRAVSDRLAATHPDVLIIDHAEVHEDGRVLPHIPSDERYGVNSPTRLAERPLLLRLAQSACTKLARRAFLDEIGLRFLPGWYEDSSFSHPLLMAAQRIDVLRQVCYCYRRRSNGSITTTVSPRHFEVFDQYERIFDMVDRSAGSYDAFRPELFLLMMNHYMVIVGNEWRLPPGTRRAFFHRMVEHYRRWLPANGYPVPRGLPGLKHRLVRLNAYPAYAALRWVHRATAGVRQLRDLWRAEPVAAALPIAIRSQATPPLTSVAAMVAFRAGLGEFHKPRPSPLPRRHNGVEPANESTQQFEHLRTPAGHAREPVEPSP